jgi:hypothetical protein
MATNDFPVLLALSDSMQPLEVFDRKYLLESPSREIWLSKTEAWLPSDGLKLYADGSLFEGRAGSGVFSEELDIFNLYYYFSVFFYFQIILRDFLNSRFFRLFCLAFDPSSKAVRYFTDLIFN